MIISVDAEKAFNKIQHPFPIKTQQRRKEGNLLNLVKGIYQNKQAKKHYSYYHLTVKDRMLSCYGEKQVTVKEKKKHLILEMFIRWCYAHLF